MGNKKIKLVQFLTICLIIILFSFFFGSLVFSQEVQYPKIPGVEQPAKDTPFFQYVKYIFNFVVIISGLIGVGVLILGGIKWLTSAGNSALIEEAKKQIWYGFLGLTIILSSYIILGTINPELVFIQFVKKPPAPFIPPAELLPTKERAKTIIAYEIPLGKLMDGALLPGDYLSEGVPESDATFGKSTITAALLDDYRNFGDELEGKWRSLSQQTDTEKMEQLMNEIQGMTERFSESYFTKIEKVSQKATEIKALVCEAGEKDCILYCEPEGDKEAASCRVSGIEKLFQLINEFQKKENREIQTVKNELEKAVEDIKNILNLDLIKGTAGLDDLSRFDEDYSLATKNLVKEIVAQTKKIAIIKCCVDRDEELQRKIGELQATAEIFQEGYLIRKDIWRISKQSIEIKKELDNYRTFQQPNLKLKGSDYIYEGTTAPSRLDRILDLDQRIRDRSNQIRIVSLTMNTAAGVIGALTAICNCRFCKCACGPCVGDPCWPVRPALIAAQTVLAAGAATLPPLSSQLQKEVNKITRERGKLKDSVERLTEGLEKGEGMLKACLGRKNLYQANLLSLHNFLNYKEEIEKWGYQIRIIKPWPEIEIKDDTNTFYCLNGPIVPGITEGSYPLPSSPFGGRKVACEREIEVESLIKSIKNVVKGRNQMLDQTEETIKSSQKVINEATKKTPKNTSEGTAGDLLKKGVPSELADKIPREIFRTLSGSQVSEILKDTFKSMSEKYAKDLTHHIFGNLPGKEVKDMFLKSLGAMSGKDSKVFLSGYFDSLKNEAKKEVSQAIFEGMTGSELKGNLKTVFASIEGSDLKELWKETLVRFGKEGRAQFFESAFDKMPEKDLLTLYGKLSQNLPSTELRKILKETLRNSPATISTEVLKGYPGQTFEEKIENIPERELKDVSQETGDLLYQGNLLKRAAQGLPENHLESAINQIPSGELKDFTQILFEGLPEDSIKDFVFYDILDSDPNFLPRMLNYVPEREIKNILLNNALGPIEGEDLKNVLGVASFSLKADPRTFLNSLVLKHIPEGDKLMKAANIISNQTHDEFLEEIVEVVPGLDGIKDMLDKLSPYIQDINKTINSILDAVSLTQTQLVGFIGDILNQLPEIKLRDLAKEIGKYLPVEDIKKIIGEVLKQMPPDVIRKVINELLVYLPKEVSQKISEILEKISDAELLEKLPEILDEILKYIPKDKLNEVLKKLFYYIPDLKLPDIMNQISKYIPAKFLRDYLNTIFGHLPLDIGKVLGNIFDKVPAGILKDITDGIFEKLPFGAVNKLMEKISSYLPDKLLKPYIDKLLGFVEGKLDGILNKLKISFPGLPIGLGVFSDILAGIISGPPALKQNAKEMIKLPPQFTSAYCSCTCPKGVPTRCKGERPPGPYKEVLKRFAYILTNNLKIIFNQNKLTNSTQITDNLINVKIKKEIYGSLRNSRTDFGECFAQRKIYPPVEKQLYKAEDAARYGWIEKFREPFNLVCCYPVAE